MLAPLALSATLAVTKWGSAVGAHTVTVTGRATGVGSATMQILLSIQ